MIEKKNRKNTIKEGEKKTKIERKKKRERGRK